jgi:hypothetical protein
LYFISAKGILLLLIYSRHSSGVHVYELGISLVICSSGQYTNGARQVEKERKAMNWEGNIL